MDYGSKRIYTVADSRHPVYCTYSTRPDGFGSTPLSLQPQPRIIQCNAGEPYMNHRVVVVPSRIRSVAYAGLEDEDEEEADTYVPSYSTRIMPSHRISNYIDSVCNFPQMEDITAETRKIKRDAQAVLTRLNQSYKKTPAKLSSVYCPDLTYTGSTYFPGTYSSIRTSTDRDLTPDVDDSSYYRTRRAYTYGPTRILQDPIAKVQSEINRKAIYSADCRKINDSVRGAVRRPRVSDADQVKNRINFRAQYASLRAAANVGLRKNNDYLML